MSEIVKSKDGRITFRKSEFKSMAVHDENLFWGSPPEIVIYTDSWSGGHIFKYSTFAEAEQIAKEIQEQL